LTATVATQGGPPLSVGVQAQVPVSIGVGPGPLATGGVDVFEEAVEEPEEFFPIPEPPPTAEIGVGPDEPPPPPAPAPVLPPGDGGDVGGAVVQPKLPGLQPINLNIYNIPHGLGFPTPTEGPTEGQRFSYEDLFGDLENFNNIRGGSRPPLNPPKVGPVPVNPGLLPLATNVGWDQPLPQAVPETIIRQPAAYQASRPPRAATRLQASVVGAGTEAGLTAGRFVEQAAGTFGQAFGAGVGAAAAATGRSLLTLGSAVVRGIGTGARTALTEGSAYDPVDISAYDPEDYPDVEAMAAYMRRLSGQHTRGEARPLAIEPPPRTGGRISRTAQRARHEAAELQEREPILGRTRSTTKKQSRKTR